VRYFVMGANAWREASGWPPPAGRVMTLYFDQSEGSRKLRPTQAPDSPSRSVLAADPARPVADPYGTPGANDYRALASRPDVLTFDTDPLPEDLWVAGDVTALIHASCDCRDFDLWVRLQDVYPDGRAFNLMSPGNDVVRASYREPGKGRQPVEPGRTYELQVRPLMTGIRFPRGHRIRVQISASFDPHLSRNLQTGRSEVLSTGSRAAEITIHHGPSQASAIALPLISPANGT
jgi:putative CocE/NonD family hydrolase